jgi:hypothetical protein
MREMRPLLLPDLVASQHQSKAATSTPDESALPSLSHSVHASMDSTDSLTFGLSDTSSPSTSAFSGRHFPNTGSTSSLASTPPTYESVENLSASAKLPDLVEEPTEPGHEFVVVDEDTALSPCLCTYEKPVASWT